jgi:peptidoglycan hydrolase-like protein with peptidoglycan-binding domain/3D (Asp-Asp-Asp) domain-containing protein
MNRFRRFVAMLSVVSVLALTPNGLLHELPNAQAQGLYPYVKTFTISAYYSPLPDQDRYATGSYDRDIRLNGNGTNGADGTEVYPGMIAAPKTYAFGTKMDIPGVGMTAVHDRGGAIVTAGNRNQTYDRLDIWMGFGDAGLTRALNWGKRAVDVTVYGVNDTKDENVYLAGYSASEAFVKHVVLAPQLFSEDIWYLSTGEDVEELQGHLASLGYYSGDITGYYGADTREAVYQFQLAENVVDGPTDIGAGHTGVNTRRMLDLALARVREDEEASKLKRFQTGLLLLEKHPDLNKKSNPLNLNLSLGSVGDGVTRLQNELVTMGLLRVKSSGYYGQSTEHAVFKFQQRMGILESKDDHGAGVFGPQTRSHFNRILDNRLHELSYIAVNREERSIDPVIASATAGPFHQKLVLGDRGEEVKDLQQLLKSLGFFKGLFITEFYGEQTKASVLNFQVKNGLSEDGADNAGVLDAGTRALLNELH